ncbi:unnamed protein product [Plutella xylostella]|uniref:(diamondback moth) hypothetical protein n=1 Tax=Plutella xylostella TaxID=51655 RepID=A0A8S4G673_PLUXY|nr:unnamed protein product [Plutella xylostella]
MNGSIGKGGGGWRAAVAKRVPAVGWMPRYTRLDATGDLVAGLTLGLTLVPQAIAYASLAGLPVHVGLYSSFVGTLVYVLFGTVKEVSIGPTSLMALLTLQVCRGLPLEYVTLLTLLSGVVVSVMGLLQMGFLVELISPSVTSGFTSGTAVIVMAAQVKGLLGLSFSAESIPENVQLIAANVSDIRVGDCVLSAVCCTVLLSLRKLKDVKTKSAKLQSILWLISISRNAIVVCAASVFAFIVHNPVDPWFKLSGRVSAGLPSLSIPAFSVANPDGSVTGTSAMLHELGAAVLVLPVVMVLANIAIAKAFTGGRQVEASQEMLTLGLCNVLGSFVGAMPTCGAFTRSAVSHSSGVRTPAAGIYSAMIVLVALSFMTEYFYFIPKACLSSVLICAVMFMIDFAIFRRLWRSSKQEFFILLLTFSSSVLLSVELSVLGGAVASVAALLRGVARPPVEVTTLKIPGGIIGTRVRPTLALVYMNMTHVLSAVPRASPVFLDLSRVTLLDHAATEALERLQKKMSDNGQKLIIYNATPEILPQLEAGSGTPEQSLDIHRLRARTELEALTDSEATENVALLTGDVEKDIEKQEA